MAEIIVDYSETGNRFKKYQNSWNVENGSGFPEAPRPAVGDVVTLTGYTVSSYTPTETASVQFHYVEEGGTRYLIEANTREGATPIYAAGVDDAIASGTVSFTITNVEEGDEVWIVSMVFGTPPIEEKALGGNAVTFFREKIEGMVGDLSDLTTTDKTNLVAAINEAAAGGGGGGGITELTTADYDYPTNNPDGIALWNLPVGWYAVPKSSNPLKVYPSVGRSEDAYAGLFSISQMQGKVFIGKWINDLGDFRAAFRRTDVNGSTLDASWNSYYLLGNTSIVNNLTTNSSSKVLSASQGKVLKDLADSLAIRGAGAPTTSTAGSVGTLYEDTTNGDLYICTDATNPYVWEEVGGGSGPTVVQTTGTSTTDVMSQNAATSMVFQDPILRKRPQIGDSASATGNAAIAIGTSSSATKTEAIGIGYNSHATAKGAVAIGGNSSATSVGEMNIGSSDTEYGYNSSNYRLLTGLYDPQNDHDAATKGYVDGLVGNIAAALNAINNGGGN